MVASSLIYGTSSATLSVTLQPTNAAGCPGASVDGLSAGAIVGIVIGSVVGCVVILLVILLVARQRSAASMDKMFSRAKKNQMETEMSARGSMKQNPAHQNINL